MYSSKNGYGCHISGHADPILSNQVWENSGFPVIHQWRAGVGWRWWCNTEFKQPLDLKADSFNSFCFISPLHINVTYAWVYVLLINALQAVPTEPYAFWVIVFLFSLLIELWLLCTITPWVNWKPRQFETLSKPWQFSTKCRSYC